MKPEELLALCEKMDADYFSPATGFSILKNHAPRIIRELMAENFKLAAGVCPLGFGDEGGTPRCCAEKEIQRLQTELAAAKEDAQNEGDLRYRAEDALSKARREY